MGMAEVVVAEEELLTAREVACLVGCELGLVYKKLAVGSLVGEKIDGEWLIDPLSAQSWLARREKRKKRAQKAL